MLLVTSPVDAPRERAFTTWPTVWMPPSAMTGTPKRRAYSATLYTEVPWGRPHAMTERQKTYLTWLPWKQNSYQTTGTNRHRLLSQKSASVSLVPRTEITWDIMFTSVCCSSSLLFLLASVTQSEHKRPVPMATRNGALADHHDNKERSHDSCYH